ncbi:MAG: hypothetical protein QW625_02815 [Candidatus Nanoarchaeia archaeon]
MDLFFGSFFSIAKADNDYEKKLPGTSWEVVQISYYKTSRSKKDPLIRISRYFFKFYNGDSCKMFNRSNNCVGKGFYDEKQIYFDNEDFNEAFEGGAYYNFIGDSLVMSQGYCVPPEELYLVEYPLKKTSSSTKDILIKTFDNTKKTIRNIFKKKPKFDLPSVVDKNVKTTIEAGLNAYGRGFLVMPQGSIEADDGKVYAINIKSEMSRLNGNKIITPMYLRQIRPTNEFRCYYYTLTIDINGNFISLERDSIGRW